MVIYEERAGQGCVAAEVCVCPPLVGHQMAKPEVISLLEQGEEPWSTEQLYSPPGTGTGESSPVVGKAPLSQARLARVVGRGREGCACSETVPLPRSCIPCWTFLLLLIQSKDAHPFNMPAVSLLGIPSPDASHSLCCPFLKDEFSFVYLL